MADGNVRSTFVTVVAWVFIILSGFVSLIALLQNVMVQFMFPRDDLIKALENNPAAANMSTMDRLMLTGFEFFLAAFLVIALVSFASAVGLLRRKNWARRLFIGVLSIGVLVNLAGLILQMTLWSAGSDSDLPADFQTMRMVIQVFNSLIAVTLVAVCAWLVWKLMSPQIKAEFPLN